MVIEFTDWVYNYRGCILRIYPINSLIKCSNNINNNTHGVSQHYLRGLPNVMSWNFRNIFLCVSLYHRYSKVKRSQLPNRASIIAYWEVVSWAVKEPSRSCTVSGEGLYSRAFSLLKATSSVFTIKNLLGHYANKEFKHDKWHEIRTLVQNTIAVGHFG